MRTSLAAAWLVAWACGTKERKANRGVPTDAIALAKAVMAGRPPHPPFPPPPTPPPIATTKCLQFPAVASNGTSLVWNDGTGRRFFIAGMVESGGAPLSGFNETRFDQILADSAGMGANAVRWNAFLKGLDFVWAPYPAGLPGLPPGTPVVNGLCDGCLASLVRGLDLAAERGLLVQLVLSTAHFLRYGYGGEGFVLHDITNRDRVHNLKNLLGTTVGTTAYIRKVLDPLLVAVDGHPALMGCARPMYRILTSCCLTVEGATSCLLGRARCVRRAQPYDASPWCMQLSHSRPLTPSQSLSSTRDTRWCRRKIPCSLAHLT